MTAQTLMNRDVAAGLDANGDQDLAWVARLTPDEAASALSYLAGRAPDVFAQVVKHVEKVRQIREQRPQPSSPAS